jgi:flagellar hook-associated protein 3 FlgL
MTTSIGTLSTLQFSLFNRRNVQRTTLALQRAGQELATGRKADIYADLGLRSASALKLRGRNENTQIYMKTNDLLDNKLQAMVISVNAARDQIGSVLENALANSTRPQNGADMLQRDANAALDSMVAILNTSFNGGHLFAGLKSDVPPLMRWGQTNPATGLSPEDAITSTFAGGPVDAASATTIADQIDLVFASNDLGNPDRNFEATIYQGSPAINGMGQPTKQIKAWVNVGQEVTYGVRANDKSFIEAYKGLALLAVTDVSALDEDAYATYMGRVVVALSNAQEGMLDASARIGSNQQIVGTTQSLLNDLSLVQRSQIGDYENVDPYEAVTRMQALEIQLEASYQVTSRLSGLSILNYLR